MRYTRVSTSTIAITQTYLNVDFIFYVVSAYGSSKEFEEECLYTLTEGTASLQ